MEMYFIFYCSHSKPMGEKGHRLPSSLIPGGGGGLRPERGGLLNPNSSPRIPPLASMLYKSAVIEVRKSCFVGNYQFLHVLAAMLLQN